MVIVGREAAAAAVCHLWLGVVCAVWSGGLVTVVKVKGVDIALCNFHQYQYHIPAACVERQSGRAEETTTQVAVSTQYGRRS